MKGLNATTTSVKAGCGQELPEYEAEVPNIPPLSAILVVDTVSLSILQMKSPQEIAIALFRVM
jgi:hypothetical protein